MNKCKKSIIIITILSLITIGSLLAIHYYRQSFITPDKSALQLFNNADIHDKFIPLCFSKNIVGIRRIEIKYSIYKNYEYLDGFYIYYTGEKLNNDDQKQLSEYLKILREYNTKNVLLNEEDHDALFYIGGFYTVYLGYVQEDRSSDEIKNENFFDDVNFLDKNWFIAHKD